MRSDPESDIVRRTIAIPITDNMMAAAYALERQLTREEHNRLFECMISIEGRKLTVDADPSDEDPDGNNVR